MNSLIESVSKKIESRQALSFEDGLGLMKYPDLLTLGILANGFCEMLHGDKTYYNWNLHLNSTNVCEANCLFCSFARLKEGVPQAYTMSLEQCRKWIAERYQPGMTEIHIVNGLNPNLPFEYYCDLLEMISSEFPALHIKAFTAVEIHYFSGKFSLSYTQILGKLIDAGLGSLPGGGAEIFSSRVRKKICADKVDAKGWLEVHRTAHRLGLKSNCTMLYGTVERDEEIVEHLISLRDLQDETGGFQAFIPLAFHNKGNRMKNLPPPTAADDLRVMAVSRLMLSNILNLKAYWVMLGIKTAQTALSFGANDFDGTVTEEKIYHMAGSESPKALSTFQIERIIKKAGRTPVQRTSTYDELNKCAPEPSRGIEGQLHSR